MNGTGIDGSDFSHKRVYPDVAYKSHELFDTSLAKPDRAPRAVAREISEPLRRSQSEGPVKRNPLFQSEYRLQFAAGTRRGRERREEEGERGQSQDSKLTISFPPPAPSSTWNRRSGKGRDRSEARAETRAEPARAEPRGEPKKSISMGQIQPTGHAPSSGQIQASSAIGAASQEALTNGKDVNGNVDVVDCAVSRNTSPAAAARREYKSEYKNRFRPFSQYEYVGEGKFHNTGSPPTEKDVPSTLVRPEKERMEKLEGEPWYKEVIELRKAAQDYKCRGWGTDMVPPYMSEIYNLHEQAANRESLSALALAITTPRSATQDEKDGTRKSSPARPRPSRPKTAPPPKSSRKSSRPESATGSPAPPTTHRQEKENQAPSGAVDGRRGVSRTGSKAQSRDTSRPPSAIENHMDYFREPVVKSPPEPTRVKSPEQLLIRSPDPINWTVPLDTGKTFSVTQSVRDGDSARNSPMSDHSSHFDSMAGTAINLGLHSVNEKGSLHYPKVSALAREAIELQGKIASNKKEEVKPLEKVMATPTPRPNSSNINSNSNTEQHPARVNGTPEPTVKVVPPPPASNLKCLEDPTFSFDEPAAASSAATATSSVSAQPPPPAAAASSSSSSGVGGGASQQNQPPPTASSTGAATSTPTTAAPSDRPSGIPQPKKPSYRVLEDPDMDIPKPKGSPYKVLEDPSMMTASIYEPAKPEPAKGRPDEVLDGARQQFDKFFKGN